MNPILCSADRLWSDGVRVALAWRVDGRSGRRTQPAFSSLVAARCWIGRQLNTGPWAEIRFGHEYRITDREAKLLELICAATGKDDPRAWVGGAIRRMSKNTRSCGV